MVFRKKSVGVYQNNLKAVYQAKSKEHIYTIQEIINNKDVTFILIITKDDVALY